jgi:hypothetical protein
MSPNAQDAARCGILAARLHSQDGLIILVFHFFKGRVVDVFSSAN